jgi:hypothetical protein
MPGGLRETRMRLLVPLHSQILVTARKSFRPETPTDNVIPVGLSGNVTERSEIAGPALNRGFSATDRIIDRKGWIGKEARHG